MNPPEKLITPFAEANLQNIFHGSGKRKKAKKTRVFKSEKQVETGPKTDSLAVPRRLISRIGETAGRRVSSRALAEKVVFYTVFHMFPLWKQPAAGCPARRWPKRSFFTRFSNCFHCGNNRPPGVRPNAGRKGRFLHGFPYVSIVETAGRRVSGQALAEKAVFYTVSHMFPLWKQPAAGCPARRWPKRPFFTRFSICFLWKQPAAGCPAGRWPKRPFFTWFPLWKQPRPGEPTTRTQEDRKPAPKRSKNPHPREAKTRAQENQSQSVHMVGC